MAKLLVISALVCLSHGALAAVVAPAYLGYAQVPYGYAVAPAVNLAYATAPAPAAPVTAAPAITDPEAAASAAEGLNFATGLLEKLVEKLKKPEELKIPTGYAAQAPIGYGYATAPLPAAPAITDPEAAASAAQGLQAATALLEKLVEELKKKGSDLPALLASAPAAPVASPVVAPVAGIPTLPAPVFGAPIALPATPITVPVAADTTDV
jgi:hypothetical protein